MIGPQAVVLLLDTGSYSYYSRASIQENFPGIATPLVPMDELLEFIQEHDEVDVAVIPERYTQQPVDEIVQTLHSAQPKLQIIVVAKQCFGRVSTLQSLGATAVVGEPPDFRLARELRAAITKISAEKQAVAQ